MIKKKNTLFFSFWLTCTPLGLSIAWRLVQRLSLDQYINPYQKVSVYKCHHFSRNGNGNLYIFQQGLLCKQCQYNLTAMIILRLSSRFLAMPSLLRWTDCNIHDTWRYMVILSPIRLGLSWLAKNYWHYNKQNNDNKTFKSLYSTRFFKSCMYRYIIIRK